jgi:hypothetical protein
MIAPASRLPEASATTVPEPAQNAYAAAGRPPGEVLPLVIGVDMSAFTSEGLSVGSQMRTSFDHAVEELAVGTAAPDP